MLRNCAQTVLLAATSVLCFGCGAPDVRDNESRPEHLQPTDSEAAVREAVFRRGLKRFSTSPDSGPDVFFIAFGEDSSGAYIDPPAMFLDRLSDLGLELRPASAVVFEGDRVPVDSAGRRGLIASVAIVDWVDSKSASVRFKSYCGTLCGKVYRTTVEWKENRWVVMSPSRISIS